MQFASDSSMRSVMDKLPGKELHGQSPVVTPYNKQHFNQFEMQARKGESQHNGEFYSFSQVFHTLFALHNM